MRKAKQIEAKYLVQGNTVTTQGEMKYSEHSRKAVDTAVPSDSWETETHRGQVTQQKLHSH